jgi:hypothetical protein
MIDQENRDLRSRMIGIILLLLATSVVGAIANTAFFDNASFASTPHQPDESILARTLDCLTRVC